MKRLILLVTALVLFAGCARDGYAVYTGTESGFLENGVFTSDLNVKMTVVGNTRKYDVQTPRRVLISYETKPVTTESAGFEIDLLGLMPSIIREPSHADALDDQASGAPVSVSNAWFSGGYLNLLFSVEGKDADKHPYTVLYTVDDKERIIFRLLHDDQETHSPDSDEKMNTFLSIPMAEAVQLWEHTLQAEGKKASFPVSVLFQWTDHVMDSGPLNLFEKPGSYTPAS